MTIQINGDTERFILAELASGKFKSAEELIAAMVSVWKDREGVSAQAVSKESSAFEAFSRLGVIGCMKPGPTDLVTHSRHMEGFGR